MLLLKAIQDREIFSDGHYTLRRNILSSEDILKSYQLKTELQGHRGCVNTIAFTQDGQNILTGSDDTDIRIFDAFSGKCEKRISTSHTNNIFSVKELPRSQGNIIISCAADGKVIKHIVDHHSSSSSTSAKVLYQHNGRAHRLSMLSDGTFLSCGEDSIVCLYDLRNSTTQPISKFHVFDENQESMSIYSISANPYKTYEYVIGGTSTRAFLYDQRYPTTSFGYLCPNHLETLQHHITSLKFNYSGQNVIASYNDDHIYSFDFESDIHTDNNNSNANSDNLGYRTCFKGHRNLQTVKQLNYLGSRDEFVVSGSDCGHIFIWNKDGFIVNMMKGDNIGAVNCLTPHPFLPFLATSGLENKAKIWGVGSYDVVTRSQVMIDKVVLKNERARERGTHSTWEGNMFAALPRHLRQLLFNTYGIHIPLDDVDASETDGDVNNNNAVAVDDDNDGGHLETSNDSTIAEDDEEAEEEADDEDDESRMSSVEGDNTLEV